MSSKTKRGMTKTSAQAKDDSTQERIRSLINHCYRLLVEAQQKGYDENDDVTFITLIKQPRPDNGCVKLFEDGDETCPEGRYVEVSIGEKGRIKLVKDADECQDEWEDGFVKHRRSHCYYVFDAREVLYYLRELAPQFFEKISNEPMMIDEGDPA